MKCWMSSMEVKSCMLFAEFKTQIRACQRLYSLIGYEYLISFAISIRESDYPYPYYLSLCSYSWLPNTGFIRSGKVSGKRVFFALVRESQGTSGKLAVVRGKIAFSFCRSGKSFIFHHQRNMYNTLITS